jgi:hypothetical protein
MCSLSLADILQSAHSGRSSLRKPLPKADIDCLACCSRTLFFRHDRVLRCQRRGTRWRSAASGPWFVAASLTPSNRDQPRPDAEQNSCEQPRHPTEETRACGTLDADRSRADPWCFSAQRKISTAALQVTIGDYGGRSSILNPKLSIDGFEMLGYGPVTKA